MLRFYFDQRAIVKADDEAPKKPMERNSLSLYIHNFCSRTPSSVRIVIVYPGVASPFTHFQWHQVGCHPSARLSKAGLSTVITARLHTSLEKKINLE